MLRIIFLFLCVTLPSSLWAQEFDYKKEVSEFINSEVKEWAKREIVIASVQAQNEKNADLSETEIRQLDSRWRGEIRKNKRPLIDRVLASELSQVLKTIQDGSEGVYTEITVIDNRGLHVGQSVMSPNYWEGDQEKWQKTFVTRSYATYISDLHFDDNTGLFQVEAAFLLVHNEETLGVVYTGINIEQLEDWKKRQVQ